jgi:hypothetical protein
MSRESRPLSRLAGRPARSSRGQCSPRRCRRHSRGDARAGARDRGAGVRWPSPTRPRHRPRHRRAARPEAGACSPAFLRQTAQLPRRPRARHLTMRRATRSAGTRAGGGGPGAGAPPATRAMNTSKAKAESRADENMFMTYTCHSKAVCKECGRRPHRARRASHTARRPRSKPHKASSSEWPVRPPRW